MNESSRMLLRTLASSGADHHPADALRTADCRHCPRGYIVQRDDGKEREVEKGSGEMK